MSKNSSGKFSKTKGAGAALLAQLEGRGEKFNKDEVIAIGKTSSKQIVWLEQGRLSPKASGLAHIIDAHGHQFNGKGISNEEKMKFNTEVEYILDWLKTNYGNKYIIINNVFF